MSYFFVEPQVETLHGAFSPELAPILTIDPGDTVCFQTLDAGWNMSRPATQDSSQWNSFPKVDPERDKGHALCGPIAIRGAKPGMTLAVQIDRVEPGDWGWNIGVDWWETRNEPDENDPVEIFFWDIDKPAQTATNQLGQVVEIRPFMGVMGMPPDEAGWHSTGPPRIYGGNIDCKELVAGSTLYLPIGVEGGLFSTGDGHARQADGELSGTGIECPMARVEMTFDLRPDLKLSTPRAHTPAGWLTLGFDPDLNKAYTTAMWSMIALITELHGISRLNALSLASLVVEMRVTQRVNGTNGVHALLPHNAFGTVKINEPE